MRGHLRRHHRTSHSNPGSRHAANSSAPPAGPVLGARELQINPQQNTITSQIKNASQHPTANFHQKKETKTKHSGRKPVLSDRKRKRVGVNLANSTHHPPSWPQRPPSHTANSHQIPASPRGYVRPSSRPVPRCRHPGVGLFRL